MDKYRDATNHNDQAEYAFDEGKLKKAILEHTRAIKLHPDYAPTYTSLAQILFEAQDYDKAESISQIGLRLDPNDHLLYFSWGCSLAGRGLYEEAGEKYAKAAEIYPDDEYTYINWGSALRRQQKYTEAMEKYYKVLEIDPMSSEAYNNLGVICFHMQMYDEAISHCEKAVSIRPDCIESYLNWGLALYQLDRYEEAKEKQKIAVEEMAMDGYYRQYKEQYETKLLSEIKLLLKRLETESAEENIRHLQKHIDGMKQILDVLSNYV